MPLSSSLWVDEMGTVFVIHHSADPSLLVVPQVTQSIYFALPKLAESLFGSSEISYRIFSVVAMAGALWLVGALAARLLHPAARWFAIFACFALRGFNFEAADARPYALGTLVFCAALWFLIRWLDTARTNYAIAFVLSAAALWYVHLIFWPLYLVFAIYGGFRLARGETQVSFWVVVAAGSAVCIAVVPVVWNAIQLYRHASIHVVSPQPAFNELINALKLVLVAGACAIAVLIRRHFHWQYQDYPTDGSSAVLILAMWLVHPVCLYLFSRLTGQSVFLDRYLYGGLPGVALVTCLAVSLAIPYERWRPLALIFGAGILISAGQWDRLLPVHQKSNWKEAAAALRKWEGSDRDIPIVCPSPFIEAKAPVWRPGQVASGFLHSNLMVYETGGRTYSFPFEPSPEAEAYARRFLEKTILPAGRFAIYGGDRNVIFWREFFASRPELANWTSAELGSYGDVKAVVFRPVAKQN